MAADVAGHDVNLAGQLLDKRAIGARTETVPVEKMRRRPAAAPIQIVKLAARHFYIAFGGFLSLALLPYTTLRNT